MGGNDDDLPWFGLPRLDPSATRLVELVCICIFAIEMVAKARILGSQQFRGNKWYTVQIILILLILQVFWCQLLARDTSIVEPNSRPLLFVSLSQSMRGALMTLLRTLPSVMDSGSDCASSCGLRNRRRDTL